MHQKQKYPCCETLVKIFTMATKVPLVKAMVFPVVMYGCESWTVKKAECWRIDAFELWCWKRLLRVPWTVRRSNQSILKEISPETPILWPPHVKNWLIGKRPWCWERLRAGGEGDDRRWDGWMASPTRRTWVWVGARSWWGSLPHPDGRGSLVCCSAWGRKELHTTEHLNCNIWCRYKQSILSLLDIAVL